MSNLKLRRADMIRLTDMTARRFDAMLMRGHAPWPQREAGRSWGEFSTEDAYRVALAHAFIRLGRSYEDAGRAVRAEFNDLVELEASQPGDLMYGGFITQTEPGEDSVTLILPLIAPHTSLFDELARVKQLVAADDVVLALTVVNATEIMKRLYERAVALGLVDERLTELAQRVRAL
ncbi:hypothetical protein [Brevundimonas sp.]|uniref:hypothetical protein n=1 Tax=Brevundimonas sp. TaxID=1871086 RepID=UPI002D55EB10|nr:hypothetical protein [Brevundimonas sp.]HYC68904.1 hypothetical protein [Brevundimonas sp.]